MYFLLKNSLRGTGGAVIVLSFQPGALWKLCHANPVKMFVSYLIFDCDSWRSLKEDLWNASGQHSGHF